MITFIIDYFKNAFSTPSMIAGQMIALVATFLCLFIYIFVNRKLIMATKLVGDVLWVFSYLLCGAMSGAITNVVSAIREGVCYFKKESWNKLWYIPAVFIAFYVGSAALSWSGPISLLPMVASFISVIGMWASNPLHTKLWCLPAIALWCTYSFLTYNVIAAFSNVFSVTSILVGLVREYNYRKSLRLK